MPDNNKVRVRFAPSPTGHLHIGSFRAALFNYLFARHHGGDYLVRIEDTDTERSQEEYFYSIVQSLSWAQMESDEPLLVQSARIGEHKKLIQHLLDQGKAYHCYCTQEEVVARYQSAHATSDTFIKYDGKCRRTRSHRLEGQDTSVVRFALPSGLQEVVFEDLIRDTVTVSLEQLDDFIIARSDGTPTYNFVVVADDAHMRITHVIRGDDHIANTPKQILLYQALGYKLPLFAHIPLILGPEGNKLSKRDSATSVVDYINDGYLPDAFINYLARLGWSYGDKEIFSRDELITYFSLDHVGKKGAVFDQDKLDWVNSMHMRAMDAGFLYAYILRYIDPLLRQAVPLWGDHILFTLIDLYKARCKTVSQLCSTIKALYSLPEQFDSQEVANWLTPESIAHLKDLVQILEKLDLFTVELVKSSIKSLCKERNIKLVVMAQPIRIALVGTTTSPGVFDLLVLIGQQESIKRLHRLLAYVQSR